MGGSRLGESVFWQLSCWTNESFRLWAGLPWEETRFFAKLVAAMEFALTASIRG